MNLAHLLSQAAKRYSHKPAIILEGKKYTFGEVDALVEKYAALLQGLGVQKGDRIALQLPKSMEFILLHLANLSLGAITLPLNPSYTPEEVTFFLTDSESSLFFTDIGGYEHLRNILEGMEEIRTVLVHNESADGLGPLLREIEAKGNHEPHKYPTQANDVAVICYTSGTTGRPKGAMITHGNLVTNMMALKKVWKWTDRDVLLHVLPLFHVHGLMVALHGGLNAGSTIIMHEKFDPQRAWETIEKEKCSMLMAVPTMYHRMMSEWDVSKSDLNSMRVFISGSAPLSENLFYHFEEATGFRILERYGMTEAQMITSNPYDPKGRIPKSVGYPLPDVHIRVVSGSMEPVAPGQVGEVWIRGDNVFKGYWQMPEKTRESFVEGWFGSGDLGYQDPEDKMRLFLVGRAKDLIISGGYNVYPKEVENVLEKCEAIQEAAIVGVPDEDLGEKVIGVVVFKKDRPEVPSEELISFCRKHLVGYKCPKQLFTMEELPRNAMGKIQKHVMQKKFSSN